LNVLDGLANITNNHNTHGCIPCCNLHSSLFYKVLANVPMT
jgi:hypothetical protein